MARLEWERRTMGVVTPSDFLTDEERAALSGPVRIYRLGEEGKAVEQAIQRESEPAVGQPEPEASTRSKLPSRDEVAEAILKHGSWREASAALGIKKHQLGYLVEKYKLQGLKANAKVGAPATQEPVADQPVLVMSNTSSPSEGAELLRRLATVIEALHSALEYEVQVTVRRVAS